MLLVGEDGWQCQTEGLDHPDQHDYEGGVVARFDGSEEDGLCGCYQAVMGGNLTGGSVTWTGSGMFAAINREICVQVMGGALVLQDEEWLQQQHGDSPAGDVWAAGLVNTGHPC